MEPDRQHPLRAILALLAILIVLAAVAHVAAGCALLPTGDHLAADRAIYEAVAPSYTAYVRADPTLSREQKDRRLRTVEGWELQTRPPK